MALSANLTRIRRYVRDPSSKLFTDSFLTSLFNDVQDDFQAKTKVLEAVICVRIPPESDNSIIYEWERAYATGTKIDRLFDVYQQSYYNVTAYFETQNVYGLDVDSTSPGAAISHPFEAWHVSTVNDPVSVRFPSNFHSATYFAYDNVSLPAIDKEFVLGHSEYQNQIGDPIGYYRNSSYDNKFILWPRPSAANHSAGVGGMDLYVEGDTENTSVGQVERRTGTTIITNTGMVLELVPTDDNVLLVYRVNPNSLVDDTTECDYPDWMQKYVEFGVAARALVSNTEGRLKGLAEYWDNRYKLGVKAVQRYKSIRLADRTLCLLTKDAQQPGISRKPLPKLPSEYPQ